MLKLLLIILIVLFALIVLQKLSNDKFISGGGCSAKRCKPVDEYKDLNTYPASKFETYVRGKIEKLTGKRFPCVYPCWMRYKGRRLELDGYNEELKLAFETQGPQHTKFSSKTDPLYSKFLRRIENDQMKLELCEKNGVGLIIIDYIVPKHLIGSYIRSRIYDIAERWKNEGKYKQVDSLGPLAYKAGDYINEITNKPIVTISD